MPLHFLIVDDWLYNFSARTAASSVPHEGNSSPMKVSLLLATRPVLSVRVKVSKSHTPVKLGGEAEAGDVDKVFSFTRKSRG